MALVRCILGKFVGVVCYCFPSRLDVSFFATRCLRVRNDARDHSSERWNYGRERFSGKFAYMASLFTPLGIFYMPQIYDMGPTALLPLRRKACWGFLSPWKIRRLRLSLNPRTWVPKASTLALDHRSRFSTTCFSSTFSPLKTSNPSQSRRHSFTTTFLFPVSQVSSLSTTLAELRLLHL